jgi:AcrR family transcriptional regulator
LSVRTEKTRAAVLEAGARLLARNPRATLGDVASEAGVGRATLHRHFKSRDALIEALALDALEATDQACASIDYYGQAASISLRETIAAIVPLGAKYAFLSYQSISADDDSPVGERLRRQNTQMRELIEAARDEGMFAKDIPIAWLASSIDSLIYAAWDAVSRGDVAANDASSLILRTLERGLQSETD